MKLDYRGPEPYAPGTGANESDNDGEAAFMNEGKRQGCTDVKYEILQRDNYCCRRCGRFVTTDTSCMDHIVPVNRFASYAMANTDNNLQTLCLDCHREKHRAY